MTRMDRDLIRNLYGTLVRSNENVRGLQVETDDKVAVGVSDCLADLEKQLQTR